MNRYERAVEVLKNMKRGVAFTGAGISVESGIPTFRGPTGLWSRYDPKVLDINYFFQEPKECWGVIKEIFYDYMGVNAKPNDAHKFIAKLESIGKLQGVITQNIDNLHQEAGSKNVIEFHGTAQYLVCTNCKARFEFKEELLQKLPPLCPECNSLLKPDFIFFGEAIPPQAYQKSIEMLKSADVLIIIGTTGEVIPASMLPYEATPKEIIEINIEPSNYTDAITTIFLKERATVASDRLQELLF